MPAIFWFKVPMSLKGLLDSRESSKEYGRIQAQGPAGATGAQKLFDRSFIRLENISLSYAVPKSFVSMLNFDRLKVFGSVRNVAVWNKEWPYGDPETGGLATRIFSVGLNATF